MKKLCLVVLLISALVCMGTVQAGSPVEGRPAPKATAKKILCPERIVTRQRLVHPVKGWDVHTGPSGPVSWTDLYTDDPKHGARINDDSMMRPIVRPTTEVLMQVAATEPAQLSNDGWMLCSYEDTRIEIARPTGLTDDRCRALHGKTNKYGGARMIGVDCR